MVSSTAVIILMRMAHGKQSAHPRTPLEGPVEMFRKGPQDTFFNMTALAPRPLSTATEMYDTDFEDDTSDVEEDYSPRISINSVRLDQPLGNCTC